MILLPVYPFACSCGTTAQLIGLYDSVTGMSLCL